MRLSLNLFRTAVLLASALLPASAATIYDNTSTDTFTTYFFSATGATAIGDSIGFGGTERLLTSAAVQFFNLGAVRGSFSAILQLYAVGSPVGATIGAPVQVDNLDIDSQQSLTVSFAFPNLLVSDFLVFAVSVANVDTGLDLGLNSFTGPAGPITPAPPAIGTSDLDSIIFGMPFADGPTEPSAGRGNLYFFATAVAPSNDIPEPASLLTLGTGLLALAAFRLRR
jgi:hypothetical protein